jgi:hypothetical protein
VYESYQNLTSKPRGRAASDVMVLPPLASLSLKQKHKTIFGLAGVWPLLDTIIRPFCGFSPCVVRPQKIKPHMKPETANHVA